MITMFGFTASAAPAAELNPVAATSDAAAM
jgi:hypothetical protein